ncbi:MAG: protein kinase [Elusimicrobia bacterium]|nr:protein kinase [Elusimicrobiota bacterium]
MNQRTPLLALAGLLVFLPSARAADGQCARDQDGNLIDPSCKTNTTVSGTGLVGKGFSTAGGGLGVITDKKKSNKTAGDTSDPLQQDQVMDASMPMDPPSSVEATGHGLSHVLHEAANSNGVPAAHDMGDMVMSTKKAKTKMGTADQVDEDQLLKQLRAQAEAKANEPANRRFRDVIMQTYEKVAADIRADKKDKYGANQGEVFVPMLELQLQLKKAEWELNAAQRRGELKPGEYETRLAQIRKNAMEGMDSIPSGDVMTYFHADFNKAWNENRDKWHKEPDAPSSGLPPSGHIGGMLDADPKNPDTLTLSAQDKLSGGDRAGGLAALNAAIANGGTADAYALRGGLRLDSNDFDGAYQDAKKALELNPGDKNAMGVLKSAEGRTSPGLASSLAAGGPGPGGSAGSAGSGGGAGDGGGFASGGFDAGRTREIPGMTAASTLASNQKLDEARRAMAMGDVQAAIGLAQRALELNPGNAEAHGFLSRLYAGRGDYRRSLASASAGLAVSPRDASLLNSKAFAQNRTKQYRDALETSVGAIEAAPRDPRSYANRGYAYGGLGDKVAMMSDMNTAASLDPAFKKAAADAAELQLPSNADILFLFPGENPAEPAAAAAPARSRSFGLVVGAGLLGGLLLALGLLSTVLAPLKDSVVSAFTKVTRHGPSVHALEEEATPEAPPAAGASGVIRGQYEILRQIGAGGMGMVYEGTDRSLGRRVAIKKMRDELRLNPRERERFVIEAKTVASLHHPNIVDIYAIAEEGEDVYLVFEYVDGKTVHELVQAKGRLSPADALRVTQAMGEALTYAHSRGVIHRDMKPSNVMLTGAGQVKVMDFGIARMAKDALTRYSMTNSVVGTPPYMAPEQEQGVVRRESDVYSLAICSYEMLTGKLPFIGIGAGMLMNKINMSYIPPSRAIAGLPEPLDEVFLKAFQADPDQRHHTPQEFASALAAALGGARSIKPV